VGGYGKGWSGGNDGTPERDAVAGAFMVAEVESGGVSLNFMYYSN